MDQARYKRIELFRPTKKEVILSGHLTGTTLKVNYTSLLEPKVMSFLAEIDLTFNKTEYTDYVVSYIVNREDSEIDFGFILN